MTRFRSMRRFVSEQIFACPSSKMRLTTKVRVSNGSGGSVSGDLQIEICGMKRCVTSLLRPSLSPLNPICSIAKTLISLGLRSDVFLARDKDLAGQFAIHAQ